MSVVYKIFDIMWSNIFASSFPNPTQLNPHYTDEEDEAERRSDLTKVTS